MNNKDDKHSSAIENCRGFPATTENHPTHKPSHFNIFVPTGNGNTLLFNSATAALGEIESSQLEGVKALLADPENTSVPNREDLLVTLKEGRFLIPEETDEMIDLVVRNRQCRFGKNHLGLTIAPTLACNFRCDYCYESPQSGRMTPEVESALLAFCEKHARRSEGISVTWYGGEPTLCLDIIERLQDGLQKLAERYALKMQSGGIVSNGYLLDKKAAERLSAVGITDTQITLDGPAWAHDQRRRLANGQGTFAVILNNLTQIADILRVTIRVNVDQQNQDVALELLDQLKTAGIIDKVSVYFGQVTESTGVCADLRERCLSTLEFSEVQLDLYRKLIACGFKRIAYPMIAPGGHCGADTDHFYVIGPEGQLYKCWEEVASGQAATIGSILSETLEPFQQRNLHRYLAWDPLQKPGCLECQVLPVCMGGCPHHALKQPCSDKGVCSPWKYNLDDMLLLFYSVRPETAKDETE